MVSDRDGLAQVPPFPISPGMAANASFFGDPVWGDRYFQEENRSKDFGDRWRVAHEQWHPKSWRDAVIVDVGCGPGNLYATLGADSHLSPNNFSPKILIGVDVSAGALHHAKGLGYVPLLADAHQLPLRDRCADIVWANALLHHCDDMAVVLAEAARLVRPGGLLITDMDPQRSAWNYQGLGRWLYRNRFWMYRLMRSPSYKSPETRAGRLATEIHNRQPGMGVDLSLYAQVLPDLGFDYQVYPHNHFVDASLFDGNLGRAPFKMRLGQWLSGINPKEASAGLSVMCVAQRRLG